MDAESMSSLAEYLYQTPYGEEDEETLHNVLLTSEYLLKQERIQDLSWHAQWRVWLRTTSHSHSPNSTCSECECERKNNPNLHRHDRVLSLPHIFAQLQACLLIQKQQHDFSSSMWDDNHNEEMEEMDWKRDEMLLNWNTTTRYFVHKQLQDPKLVLTLNRQDQLDVQRIMQGIDQLVAVGIDDDDGHVHGANDNNKNPLQVLQDYYNDNDKQNSEDSVREDCTATATVTAESAMQFRSWVASQCQRQEHDKSDAERLLEVVERVPQWRVRHSVANMMLPQQQDLLHEACGGHRGGRDDLQNHFRRGRALLASFLIIINNNNKNMSRHQHLQPQMAPVPYLSSTTTSNVVSSLVQDYLLHHDDNNKGIPNVHELVLTLWDFHVKERDILETLQEFASWFPVEPILMQYRTMLLLLLTTIMEENDDNKSVQQVLRATDMVCTLIGKKEVEEWNEIWNDALCRDALLPLLHAAVLDPDEASLEKCALLSAALERLFHHYNHDQQDVTRVIVTSCPQLGWIVFLLSDLPMPKDDDDVTRKIIVHPMGQLSARLLSSTACGRTTTVVRGGATAAVDSVVCLPPLSVYIDSVLCAASLVRPSDRPTHVWERHVVRTLSLYSDDDKVAVEWIQGLSAHWKEKNDEEKIATNPLVESLHQRVCLSLWGPNIINNNAQRAVVPSVSLPQLLTNCAKGGGGGTLLLWTPPECLFATAAASHQEDNSLVFLLLRQLCLTYGTNNNHRNNNSHYYYYLSHIVVGIALLSPYISSACRNELYQYLRNVVVNGDTAFVKRVERDLLPYPLGLQWWKELHADLVRNEVPAFVVEVVKRENHHHDCSSSSSSLSESHADVVDNIVSKRRKRQREEHNHHHHHDREQQEALEESFITSVPPKKARSKDSATDAAVLLGKHVWSSSPKQHVSPVETRLLLTDDRTRKNVEEVLPCLENDADDDDGASSRSRLDDDDDDDDYYCDHDEEDDRILLL